MIQNYKNVFITVGTTQFDQLINSILMPDTISTLHEIGCQQLTIQYGKFSNIDTLNLFQTIPGINVKLFDYTKSITDFIRQADLVIGHAGAGTSLEVLRLGKPLLIVVNDCLMDNHQLELAKELFENKFAVYTNIQNFVQTLKSFDKDVLKPFPKHNPKLFRDFIRQLYVVKT